MAEEKKGSWSDVFKTFKYAISPQKLLVALIGLVVFNLLGIAFFQQESILPNASAHLSNAFAHAAGNGQTVVKEVVADETGVIRTVENVKAESGVNLIRSFDELTKVFQSFLPGPPAGAPAAECGWHYARVGLFYLCVWIVFAGIVGVITRISAVQVARDENIGLKEAFKFSMRKYPSYFAPPVLVVMAFAILGVLLNFIIGLLNLVPVVGPTLFALLFPLALIISLAAVVVMVFGILGSPLMGPAIGVEGQDTFDALSRAYHYSIQRLGRYVLYAIVLLFFMSVSVWFVKTFIIGKIDFVTSRAIPLAGLGTDRKDQSPDKADAQAEGVGRFERMSQAYRVTWPLRANYIVERGGSKMLVVNKEAGDRVKAEIKLDADEEVGGFILGIWLKGLRYLVGAFAISFFFTGSTIIYYVLRKQIDGAEMDEVFMEGEEEEFEFAEENEEKTEGEGK